MTTSRASQGEARSVPRAMITALRMVNPQRKGALGVNLYLRGLDGGSGKLGQNAVGGGPVLGDTAEEIRAVKDHIDHP